VPLRAAPSEANALRRCGEKSAAQEYLLESTDRLVKFAGNLNDNPGRLRVVSASGLRDAKKVIAEAIVRLHFEKLLTGRDHVEAKMPDGTRK
jgi:hypothetical protein